MPRRRPWGHRPRTRPPPCFVGAPAIRAPCGACHVRALRGGGRCLVVGGGGARRVCAFCGANVGLNCASGRHRCARAPRGGGRCLVGGGDGARQSPCRHEVSARADALSALRALSSTLSRPGGPKNAAELNGSSRWASLDVQEAGKTSAGLTPCPVSPLNFPPGFLAIVAWALSPSRRWRHRSCRDGHRHRLVAGALTVVMMAPCRRHSSVVIAGSTWRLCHRRHCDHVVVPPVALVQPPSSWRRCQRHF